MSKTTKLDRMLDKFIISEEALKADGFDDCVLGVDAEGRIVYDAEKMIRHIVKDTGMSYDDAEEHFTFKIVGTDVGDFTPLYVWKA